MSSIFGGSLKSFFYICNYWWWNGQLSKWARLVLSSPCTTLHRCTSIKKTYYCKRDWWHQTIRQHQGKIWPPSQNPSFPSVVQCTSGDRINMSDVFCGNGMAFSAKSSTAANKLLCIRIMPTVCSHQIFSFAKKTWNQKFKIWAAIWGRIFFQGSGQYYNSLRHRSCIEEAFWERCGRDKSHSSRGSAT